MASGDAGGSGGPPFDEVAEQNVLGAILVRSDVMRDVGQMLKPEDFYRESNRAIYRAMDELDQAKMPIDIVLVAKRLREIELLDVAGGTAYLSQLSARVATTVNVKAYAEIVRDKAMLRRVIDFGQAAAYKAATELEDVGGFVDELAREANELARQKTDRSVVSLQDALLQAVDHVQKLSEQRRSANGVTGVPSGFRDLDKYTSGWQPSDLIILAARPGMGKTAFALNMLINAAKNANQSHPGVIFSLEMSKEQLATRLWASEARVPIERLRNADLDPKAWEKLFDRVGTMKDLPIFIDDTPAISIAEMMRKCRQLHHEHNLGIVMVDYLQLMTAGSQSKQASREQQISEISRNLKALAKELSVPVVALSQLNRGVESRTDKRPQLSDLRESGAIEQDADIITFLYREDYYAQMKGEAPGSVDAEAGASRMASVTEVIIAKHRSGSTGRIELEFHAPYTLFADLKRHGEPPAPRDHDFMPGRDAPARFEKIDHPSPPPQPETDAYDPFDPEVPL